MAIVYGAYGLQQRQLNSCYARQAFQGLNVFRETRTAVSNSGVDLIAHPAVHREPFAYRVNGRPCSLEERGDFVDERIRVTR